MPENAVDVPSFSVLDITLFDRSNFSFAPDAASMAAYSSASIFANFDFVNSSVYVGVVGVVVPLVEALGDATLANFGIVKESYM